MNSSAVPVEFFDMPVKKDGGVDGARLAAIVDMCALRAGPGGLCAAVENVSSRPGQAHQFSFGTGFGIVLGVLEAAGVPYSLISPAQWKPAMALRRLTGESQQQNKSRARELASKLLPEYADKFARVRDDGRAEAYLMGRFHIFKHART
jgi:crossover junction endodeoxyribonuclease RuvC